MFTSQVMKLMIIIPAIVFMVSISLLRKILNACQNEIHGILANVFEIIHQFLSSTGVKLRDPAGSQIWHLLFEIHYGALPGN